MPEGKSGQFPKGNKYGGYKKRLKGESASLTKADEAKVKFNKAVRGDEEGDLDDLERALLAVEPELLDTELVKQFITYRRGFKEDQDENKQAPPLDCLDDFSYEGTRLTWRQRRLVETVINNPSMNFEEVGKHVGFGQIWSKDALSRALKKPHVREAMKTALAYINQRYGFDQDKVWRLLIDRATVDIGDVADWDEHGNVTLRPKRLMSTKARRGVKSISVTRGPGGTETTKVELWDPYPYIRDLQKLYKMAEPSPEEALGKALVDSMMLGRQRAIENRVAPIEGEFTKDES